MTYNNLPSKTRSIAGDVDLPRLVAALHELSRSFVNGEQGRYGMRITAEPYRDGDLVCAQAARMIDYFSDQWVRRCKEVERLRAALLEISSYDGYGDRIESFVAARGAPTQRSQGMSCPECGSPFPLSHFPDCRAACAPPPFFESEAKKQRAAVAEHMKAANQRGFSGSAGPKP